MPSKAFLLAFIVAVLGVARVSGQPRHSVIVLVDESGSLQRDPGWRNKAATLLAYSLPEGNALAISGFGNKGRILDLRPLALADAGDGRQNRDLLATRSLKLGAGDRQTDIYGAITQSLDQFAEMAPEIRQAAPPILIVLSDFRPDPNPTDSEKASVCRSLQQTNTQFIAVGFGSVNKAVMHELTTCSAGGLEWGIVSDFSALFDVFWKLEHRLTQQVPLAAREIATDSESFRIDVPGWAKTLLVLATGGHPGWVWKLPPEALEYDSNGFRLIRLAGGTSALNIPITGGSGVRIAAVGFGSLSAALEFDPPKPWVTGETVTISAQLHAMPRGDLVEQWRSSSAEEASATWRLLGESVYLAFDPNAHAFKGFWRAGRGTGNLSIDIGGGNWQHEDKSEVSAAAVTFSGLNDGVLFRRALFKDSGTSMQALSQLRNRSFDLIFEADGLLKPQPEHLHFGPGQHEASIRIQPSNGGRLSLVEMLRAIVEPPWEQASILRVSLVASSGERLAASEPIRVVVTSYPLWQRLGLALSALGGALMLLVGMIAGRRFPAWFLIETDTKGKRVPGGRVLALGGHRRRIAIESIGLGDGALRCSLLGRVSFHRSGDVELWPGGRSPLADQRENGAVQPGDIIAKKRSDGTIVAFTVERG